MKLKDLNLSESLILKPILICPSLFNTGIWFLDNILAVEIFWSDESEKCN